VVEPFSHFFVSKIAAIRATFDAVTSCWTLEAHKPVVALSTFSAGTFVYDILSYFVLPFKVLPS
jgi:hypothetical protein